MPGLLHRTIATRMIVAAGSLSAVRLIVPAAADLGPCITAVPTGRDMHLFVSDVDRASRGYRDNAGLTEQGRWLDQTFGGATLVSMQRGLAGVTLVNSLRGLTGRFRDPQMVCFALDGLPAAETGRLFLADPDGTSVELPPAPVQPSTASNEKSRSS